MKKKKKVEQKENKLTPSQYWEWRTTVEEMKTGELTKEKARMQMEALRSEIELTKLKLKIFQLTAMKKAIDHADDCRNEYNKFTDELEKQLGFTIKEKVIDPYSYEVKNIED